MATTLSAIDLPFEEAIAYLGGKTNVTSEDFTDVMGKANVRSFTVAGAGTQALVDDFRREVAKALEKGTTLQDFRGQFDAIVAKHGWEHTGSPGWRSRVIYETNLGMAYSAGRYAQQTEPETLAQFPYWQYVHSGALHPRLQHKAWDGITLRADDPWWDTHYPPNGWRCGCRTRPLSARGLARQGKSGPDTAPPLKRKEYTNKKTGEVYEVPEGIDPGFDYNPGREWTGKPPQIPANATLQPKGSTPAGSPPPAPAPAAAPPASRPAPAAPPAAPAAAPAAPAVAPAPILPGVPGLPVPPVPAGLVPKLPGALKPKPPAPAPAAPAPAAPAPSAPPPLAVRAPADLAPVDRQLHDDFKAWGRKLALEERDALASYKGSGFVYMNQHLRNLIDDPGFMPRIRALVRALDRAKTKRAVTVHRGVGPRTPWEGAKVGDTVADAGFMSTSVNPNTAQNFGSGTITIEIRLPKGYSGGAYVNRIPDVNHPEFEFLIRPGAPFRVIERTGNRLVVEPVRGGRRRSPKLD